MKPLFWISALSLFYIYFGYWLALELLGRIARSRSGAAPEKAAGEDCWPSVSVIVAAHNEESRIRARIENLQALDYPPERMEILVASDGSTDGTVAAASAAGIVEVLAFREWRGRAEVHNAAAAHARGDILVFTDAGTLFERHFLARLVAPFRDPRVDCVVGRLVFHDSASAIGASEGAYWAWETRLRALESRLGILCLGTGAAMAARRGRYVSLRQNEDVDDVLPLEVAKHGGRVVFAEDAVASDEPNSSVERELRARVRMTSQSLAAIVHRWGASGFVRHPLAGAALFSHKVLRWFTPFFLLGALVGAGLLAWEGAYGLAFAAQVAFYAVAAVGLAAELGFSRRVRVASAAFSFCVANAAMCIGVLKGLLGRAPASY
jgi:cellulose synthase/poly-beta-1,6-N-acetylglucosamine synthase-like glycosyltransferase